MEQLITLWCSESVVGIKRARKEREDKNSLNAKKYKTKKSRVIIILEEGKALRISRGKKGKRSDLQDRYISHLGPLEGTSSGGPEPLVHLIVTWLIFPVLQVLHRRLAPGLLTSPH